MQCVEGRPGRVFVIRIDHGEDLIDVLLGYIREKEIRCGFVQVLGALNEGSIVTGPREPVLPPDPNREMYEGGWEVIGIGSISWSDDGPYLHLHSSLGRGPDTRTGCLRELARVYIVVEAIILEIAGIEAVRMPDPTTGLTLPRFLPGNSP